MNACITAGAALVAVYGHFLGDEEPLPRDGNAGQLVSRVAKAAELAAEAAASLADESMVPFFQAYRWALGAADDQTLQFLRRDAAALFELASYHGWTDRSPVPGDIWEKEQEA